MQNWTGENESDRTHPPLTGAVLTIGVGAFLGALIACTMARLPNREILLYSGLAASIVDLLYCICVLASSATPHRPPAPYADVDQLASTRKMRWILTPDPKASINRRN